MSLSGAFPVAFASEYWSSPQGCSMLSAAVTAPSPPPRSDEVFVDTLWGFDQIFIVPRRIP